MSRFSDIVRFYGHPRVSALHPRTIEVTTEDHLTVSGDCIIGVGADKGIAQLTPGVRNALKRDGSRVTLTLKVDDSTFTFNARGSSALPLDSGLEMVIRRSDYICGRTLAVGADAACRDIPREIVQSLRSRERRGTLTIEVET